ncbi:MAG TPA: CooT family nickel-binding protein [Syntrophomonadaceae bacterium]|nr:CooT family nickel-binding protein [Syntrophomonadaceae bacterium]
MCEANVYIIRNGREELLMEKVDHIVPSNEGTIFLESIFGERKVVKASIREMELVHHRIILDEIEESGSHDRQLEIWLEPDTTHGHFHEGEKVEVNLFKGYNMHQVSDQNFTGALAFVAANGEKFPADIREYDSNMKITLDQEIDGLVQMYAVMGNLWAKTVVEVGHHHHHGIEPAGMPLEIVPSDYSHARLGESYEVQVLKEDKPLAGAQVKATYTGTHNEDYPHRLTTDSEGKARLFLTARGNYLFSVSDGDITSTFTLIKSF